MLPDKIRTARLELRPLKLTDAKAVHASLTDWEVIRWLDEPPHPYEWADATRFVAHPEIFAGSHGRIYAIDNGDGLIGALGIEERRGAMHLAYWLSRAHWGLGLMSEAARAAVDAFFSSCSDLLLVSGMIEGNEASWRIQRRLGFVRVGEGLVASRPLGRRVPYVATWLGRARWEENQTLRAGRPTMPLAAEQRFASVPSSARHPA